MAKLSRGQIQDLLSHCVFVEPTCRDRLLANPKAFVETLFDCELPEQIHVRAIEETADTVYVIVPYRPEEGTELDDTRIESVAGGLLDKTAQGTSEGGVINVRQVFNFR